MITLDNLPLSINLHDVPDKGKKGEKGIINCDPSVGHGKQSDLYPFFILKGLCHFSRKFGIFLAD